MKIFKRSAFTVLELLFAMILFAVMSFAVWEAYVGGNKQLNASGEGLSAIQNSMLLMESFQQDFRQLAVLSQKDVPIIPVSLYFSTNGKSIMLRKSAKADTNGKMQGSAFTVVVYQLVKHPTLTGVYTMHRLERTSDGTNLLTAGSDSDERDFRSLLIKDVRFDMIVRLDDANVYRMFVRVSLTCVNTSGDQGDQQGRIYFISNLFQAASPEFILNQGPGNPGFSRRFLLDGNFVLTEDVLPGSGYVNRLPPTPVSVGGVAIPGWPDSANYLPFRDFFTESGGNLSPAGDFPNPPAGTVADPFDSSVATSGGPSRETLCQTATDSMAALVGDQVQKFRGRIEGNVPDPDNTPPQWNEGFVLDSTTLATKTIKAQVNDALTRICAHNSKRAVELYAHLLIARVNTSGSSFMVDDTDAQKVLSGN